jgi:hypothetical protein
MLRYAEVQGVMAESSGFGYSGKKWGVFGQTIKVSGKNGELGFSFEAEGAFGRFGADWRLDFGLFGARFAFPGWGLNRG